MRPFAGVCLAIVLVSGTCVGQPKPGVWGIAEVRIDSQSPATLNYSLNDPRLVGRSLTITAGDITTDMAGSSYCKGPRYRRERSTLDTLVKQTMAGRQTDPQVPVAKDFGSSNGHPPIDIEWLSCQSGGMGPVGPPGPASENWLVNLPNGELALRRYDNSIVIARRSLAQARPTPSFSCLRAVTAAEKAICGSTSLASLDRSIALSYSRALQQFKEAGDTDERKRVENHQKKWLTERNKCGADTGCPKKPMEDRLESLAKP